MIAVFKRAGASAQEFLKGTVENVARASLKWALGVSTSYLIAAALAIASLVFILGAASDGLVAAGLPAFAADLVLAALAAGISFLFYLRGKNKKLAKARKKEEARTSDAPGLHVSISRRAPRRGARKRHARWR